MASSNDIVEFEKLTKSVIGMDNSLIGLSSTYMKLVKNMGDVTEKAKEHAVTIDALTKAQKDAAETQKVLDAANKALAQSEAKLNSFDAQMYEQIQKNNKALADQKKEINDKLKAEGLAETSLVRMRQKLSELTAAYDKSGTRTKAAAEEINKLSREIGVAEAATNRHQRGVGGYLDQLGKMPGPLGAAVSGLKAVGIQLWELVANPIGAIIAAIVLAFVALYEVFTSTAAGGKFIKEVMASIGAIFDVVKQRAVVLIDAFKALFSGDFSKAADLFSQSVSGIGDQMKKAATEAWALVDAQSQLNKELAYHISEEAEETNQIQKNLFYAKDKTKTEAQRIGYLKEAQRLSMEQSKKEEEFAKRQYDLDLRNAALKTAVTGITKDQIAAFIQMNSEEQNAAMKSSRQLQDFYNLIKLEGITTLEESFSKTVEAETKFFEKNKRSESQLSTLMVEMAKEREAKKLEAIEIANLKAKEMINQEHLDGVSSDEQYKQELINQEIKFLHDKQKLYKAGTKEFEDIQVEIQNILIKSAEDQEKTDKDKVDKELKRQQDLSKSIETTIDDQFAAQEKADNDRIANEIKNNEKSAAEFKKAEEKKAEDAKKMAEKIKEIQIQMASEAINGIFDLGSAKRDEELSALEKEKTKKLAVAGLTANQKAKIEEDYAKKIADIKTKQAKSDKLQAMFNIALNTAMGSIKAVAEFPLTGGMPFLAWVIAAGALQLGLAAAQPIPKFAKGTDSAPGMGIFGEAGRELAFLRSGEVMLAEKPTFFEGSKFKGAKIYSNPETERLINGEFSGSKGISDDRILKGLSSVEQAIRNKPVAVFDNEYKPIGQQYSHHQTIYLNKLTRMN